MKGHIVRMVAGRILVTGANGRIGRILRIAWPQELPAGLQPLWQARGAVPAGWLRWDMLAEGYGGPPLPGGVVLNLAGVTAGPGARLEANGDLALAACEAARQSGARHVFLASSAAIYGPGEGADLTEERVPRPANPYGLAKARMEQRALDWQAAQGDGAPGLTLLRIGNVLGSDSLIGGLIGGAKPGHPVVLDPVPGAAGGPVRSYIGPRSLARVLAQLCVLAASGTALPPILNIAAAPPVAMADLLNAAGLNWRWGPDNPAVVARVVLATGRLQRLVAVPPQAGQAAAMIDEWRSLTDEATGDQTADQTGEGT